MNLESWLASLELQVVMRPATAEDMPRVAQLTQKTNQFNLSLKRRSESEVCSLSANHSIFVVEVTDRFGDYGLVGVCILRCPPDRAATVEIDSLLISCRALGRGVEEAVLFGIVEHMRECGCRHLEAEFVSGPRNQPIVDFLKRSDFSQTQPDRFEMSVENSCSLPDHVAWTGPKQIAAVSA